MTDLDIQIMWWKDNICQFYNMRCAVGKLSCMKGDEDNKFSEIDGYFLFVCVLRITLFVSHLLAVQYFF